MSLYDEYNRAGYERYPYEDKCKNCMKADLLYSEGDTIASRMLADHLKEEHCICEKDNA